MNFDISKGLQELRISDPGQNKSRSSSVRQGDAVGRRGRQNEGRKGGQRSDNKRGGKKYDNKTGGKKYDNKKGGKKHDNDLTYSDLDYYFNKYSKALFREEALETKFLQNFRIQWPYSDRERSFYVYIYIDANDELRDLFPGNGPGLEAGISPFTNSQVLCIATQNESTVWYTYVKQIEMDLHNYEEGRRIILQLELFRWNKTGLTLDLSDSQVKILPCGPQTTRIFSGMTRIKDSQFIDLILGDKPLRHVTPTQKLDYSRQDINESQKNAIAHVLCNKVTVIQGPPGAGKTSTIEELIIQLTKATRWSGHILIVAASNIAIDNIAERFMEKRDTFRILRIVSDFKKPQYDENHPLGEICLHNKIAAKLDDTMKAIKEKIHGDRSREVTKAEYEDLLRKQNQMADRICRDHQIIFTTTISAGSPVLQGLNDISTVIMDESTQSSEAATLVPLTIPNLQKFVFVGDEKQLSGFSPIEELEMSLFERVLRNKCCRNPHMLDTQYRMHPIISDFPRKHCYQGLLKDGVTEQQKAWKGITYPLFFLNSTASEVTVFKRDRTRTYMNSGECDLALDVVRKLILKKGVTRDEIGIIVPYAGQRDAISDVFVRDPVVNPNGLAIKEETDETDIFGGKKRSKINSINVINDIYIATVDSFQGHEKNFIIFSTVRNNPGGEIGFLKDRRRFTVASTRARNGLIIIGNDSTLRRGNWLWRDYMNYLEARQLIFSNIDEY